MDDFFYYFSKAAIIFSIIVIIFALIVKFSQSNNNNNFNKKTQVQVLISITPSKSLFLSKKIEKIGIDLNNHWICQYDFNNNRYKLEINKKKINLEIKNLKTNKTEKQDLSFYVPFIENYLNMYINELERISKLYFFQEINLKDLVKSCKKYD
ncbi:MAG: hypothetical protein NZM02_01255 [Patescibacteria group bacterium]|nr:hypothetical protein [Patescibacteria group bacterium]